MLSLRGITAGMALASINAPARTDRHWIGLLQEQAMAGVTAFQAVADDLVDRSVRPFAHLSAALNDYLAGRLVGGACTCVRSATSFRNASRRSSTTRWPLSNREGRR